MKGAEGKAAKGVNVHISYFIFDTLLLMKGGRRGQDLHFATRIPGAICGPHLTLYFTRYVQVQSAKLDPLPEARGAFFRWVMACGINTVVLTVKCV